MRGRKKTVYSERKNSDIMDVNTAAVAGTISAGGGFAVTGCSELLSSLVPRFQLVLVAPAVAWV